MEKYNLLMKYSKSGCVIKIAASVNFIDFFFNKFITHITVVKRKTTKTHKKQKQRKTHKKQIKTKKATQKKFLNKILKKKNKEIVGKQSKINT